jgi:hypothetical protein
MWMSRSSFTSSGAFHSQITSDIESGLTKAALERELVLLIGPHVADEHGARVQADADLNRLAP